MRDNRVLVVSHSIGRGQYQVVLKKPQNNAKEMWQYDARIGAIRWMAQR